MAAAGVSVPCVQVIECSHPVRSVDWSPDGTRLAVAHDGGFGVFTAEGRELWLQGDGSRFLAVRWSADGAKIAAGHWAELIIAEPQTGRQVLRYAITGNSNALCWSPDSTRIASSGARTYVLDCASGATVFETEHVSNSIAVSPDGSLVAFVTGSTLHLWNIASRQREAVLRESGMYDEGLVWSAADQRLACPTADHTIELWELTSQESVARLTGHSDQITFLAMTADGELLASGSHDHTVRVWSLRTMQEVVRLEAHAGQVRCVAFSPDGIRLASASHDRTIRIWDVTALRTGQGRVGTRSRPLEVYVERQAASVGRGVASRVPNRWVPETTSFKGAGRHANGVAILPDSVSAILGCDDGFVRRVNLANGEEVWKTAESHASDTDDVTVSRDGRLVASSARDGGVWLWDATSGKRLAQASFGTQAYNSRFSPRADLAATAADDGVRIWRTATAQVERMLHTPLRLVRPILDIDWHPHEDLLAVADHPAVCVWNARTGTEVVRMDAHPETVSAVRWSPDGALLASAFRDGAVVIWRHDERRVVQRISTHRGIHCIVWSPDGRFIASGASDDPAIRVWETATGQESLRFELEGGAASRLSWAPSGAFLAANLGGDVVRIFDTSPLLPAAPHPSRSAGPAGPAGPELQQLPTLLASLLRLGLTPPLAQLLDLQSLLTGAAPEDPSQRSLTSHPGLRQLAALRWPAAALPGLLALLLRHAPRNPQWAPPPGTSPTALRAALAEALAGEPVEPQAPPLPRAAITQAADAVDDRLLTLLELVGPDAVAADPGLPLRLLAQVPNLPALAAPHRKLLGLRLRLDQGGQAQGSGPGAERSGIDRRGDLRSLLPSQLALPAQLLRARHLRGDLLYRARTGQEPPRLRPTVLVLDVSPPTFGPVEALTRLAAHALAASLLEAGLPVVLLTAGGEGSLHVLERAADLVEIWTRRSLEPPDEARALRGARALRERLAADGLPPIVVVLSHIHFGADRPVPAVPSLRGLFVDFPGRRVRPALADACERWTSLAPADTANLHRELAGLVG